MTKPVALQASKWFKVQLLADTAEVESLFTALEDFKLFLCGAVVPKGGGEVTQEAFLAIYDQYINALKRGEIPPESLYRQMFSAVLNKDPEALFHIPVGSERELVRLAKPVIQMQPHSMDYSSFDGKFRPMVYGLESIVWGIQFSYPQLFLNPETKEPLTVNDDPFFPNTPLFKNLQRWVRNHSIPTPFLVEGKKINVPIRLGKRCLPWINKHPQLQLKDIQVVE